MQRKQIQENRYRINRYRENRYRKTEAEYADTETDKIRDIYPDAETQIYRRGPIPMAPPCPLSGSGRELWT